MAITLVQNVSAGESTPGDGAATSRSVTFASPVTPGNFVVAGVGTHVVPTKFILTDDKNNVYTNAKGTVDLQTNGYGNAAFFCMNMPNAPQTLTLTVDNVTSFDVWRLYAAEFSSAGLNVAFDQVVSQHETANGTTTATAPSLTPSQNNALVWVYLSDSIFSTKTAGSGFTLIASQTADFIGTEYQVQTAATAVAATMNRGNTGGDDWMYALSFVPAAPPPWVAFPL